MSAKKVEDVVILGGGVLGFSIAYHLAKEGIRSQVIEMDSIGARASGKSDGMIGGAVGMFFYTGGDMRSMLPFGRESYRWFQQLYLELKEKTGLEIQYAVCSFLHCALSEEEEKAFPLIASEARSEGLDVKWISGDEARSLEHVLTSEVRGALLGECAQVEPYRYTLALAQEAESLGASIKYAQAVGFRCNRNRVTAIKLSTGRDITAGTIVIAMGPWSRQAASWLGIRLPVNTVRAQTLKMVAPKHPKYQLTFTPPAVGEWPRVFMIVSPRVDGTLLVGYTEDITETWDDSRPETWSDSPSAEMRDIIVEHAVRFVPVLENAMLVEQRAAVLGYPPAGRMVMGPVPEWKNVYIAMVGDGGTGLSPVVGRIMTDLIVGGDRARKAIEEVKSISPAKFVS